MPVYLAAVSPFSVRNTPVRQSKKFVGMATFSSLQTQGCQFLIRAGKNTESRAQGKIDNENFKDKLELGTSEFIPS